MHKVLPSRCPGVMLEYVGGQLKRPALTLEAMGKRFDPGFGETLFVHTRAPERVVCFFALWMFEPRGRWH